MKFLYDSININADAETESIIHILRSTVPGKFKKRGAVVGISGGIDSSVVLALCAKAFGPERVTGVLLPEKDSAGESADLAQLLADKFKIHTVTENIGPALAGFGCYNRRDEAVKAVFPEYTAQYKMKITLSPQELNSLNFFMLTIISPDGTEQTRRLPVKEYLQIVAASNLKQRSRMNMLYYHAELRNYAVIGTANKDEHELGFFVKYGDGGADVFPIAHLYKTQVYQLAEFLGVPGEIIKRVPTTDTYTAEQTQQEFFFQAPFEILDRVWYGMEHGFGIPEIAEVLCRPEEEIKTIEENIQQKIRTTAYLRQSPALMHQKSAEMAL
jgi:NAD+ synthase